MKLVKAKEKKVAFRNLFNLYVYELTAIDPWLGSMINEDALFLPPTGLEIYFDETQRETYVMLEDQKPIGFVAFINDEETQTYCLEEMFITYAYRRKGFARDTLSRYLLKKDGKFTTHVLKKNDEAIKFIEDFLNSRGYVYEITERDEMAINYSTTL